MKKLFLIIIFIISSLSMSFNIYAQSDFKYGDINGNGRISSSDYVLLDRIITKNITLTDAQKKASDLNGDKIISIEDKDLLLKFLYGIITSFPVENTQTNNSYTPSKDQIEISIDNDSNLILKINFPGNGYQIIDKGNLSIETIDNTVPDYEKTVDSSTTLSFVNNEKVLTKKITIKDIKIDYDKSLNLNTDIIQNLSYKLDFDSKKFDVDVNLSINNSELYSFKQWEDYIPTIFVINNRHTESNFDYSYFNINNGFKPNLRILNYTVNTQTQSFNSNKCTLVIQKQNYGIFVNHNPGVNIKIPIGSRGYYTSYYAKDTLLASHDNTKRTIGPAKQINAQSLNVSIDSGSNLIFFDIQIPSDQYFEATELKKVDLADDVNTYVCNMTITSPYSQDSLTRYYPTLIKPIFNDQNFHWMQNMKLSDKNRIIVTSPYSPAYILEFDNKNNITRKLDTYKSINGLYSNIRFESGGTIIKSKDEYSIFIKNY